MQVGKQRLYVIVEGKTVDPTFYGSLVDQSAKLVTQGTLVIPVEMINGGAGKSTMLALFDKMRRRNFLRVARKSGDALAVFMLDRDSDFVVGGTRRSAHVIYTEGYDAESDVFRHASFEEAVKHLLHLTPAEAFTLAASVGNWHDDLATRWRRWITLCCVANYLNAGCPVTFRRVSHVNLGVYGNEDRSLVQIARR